MNKAELIDAIHADLAQLDLQCSKASIDCILDATSRAIKNHLANCDAGAEAEAILPGLGKLKTTTRAARTGRNPQTGAPVEIPERVAIKFSASKALAEALNK